MSFIDFINLNIVLWGDNSYYPIKFYILLYIIPCNTVIFNQNPQNFIISKTIEPVHEISNKVVCATSKASDQPAHARSLIRAFASLLSIL